MGAHRLALDGQRFGRLVVIDFASTSRNGVLWNVRCDCGRVTTALGSQMKYGRIQSCGCLRGESFTRNVLRAKKGGVAGLGRDFRERVLSEIFGDKVPREIDRRHKTWAGAEDAAATLGKLWT